MRPSSGRRLSFALGAPAALVLAVGACNAILDNEERTLRPAGALEGGAPGGEDADAPPLVAEDAGGDGSCSSDLRTDAKHCGRCDHDCLGGACELGVCQPFVFAKVTRPQQVFVVDGALYFSDGLSTGADGGVSWCPVEGPCASPPRIALGPGAFGLAVDAQGLAIAAPTAGFVYTYPLRFPASVTGQLRVAGVEPVGAALDANNVYFTTASGAVHRCNRTTGCGGTPPRIATGTGRGGHLAVDATNVYWASDGSAGGGCDGCLQGAPKTATDATPSAVSLGRKPQTFSMNGTRLFWTGIGGAYGGEVSWRDEGVGGNEFFYARQVGRPWGVAADAAEVFFTIASDGTVRRCPRAGCGNASETIATAQTEARGIAVDAKAVYWASFADNVVMKLAR
ncbi:MAG: hypothetical protein KF795_20380 [Labilithrix sp.]|nr:hypothetical protein [Labilithrix sp.]MBX3222881.1 hypothetical protein [Labilithrix sp.]